MKILSLLLLLLPAVLTAQTGGLILVSSQSNAGGTTPPPPPEPGAPESIPLRMRAAGTNHTDPASDVWEAPRLFTGGSTSTYTGTVTGPAATAYGSALFNEERFGTFSFTATVPNGTYLVTLPMCERYRTSAGRTFDVSINSVLKLDDYDVFVDAGGKDITVTKSFQIVVAAGSIAINWTSVTLGAIADAVLIEDYVAAAPSAPTGVAMTAEDGGVILTFTPDPTATATHLYWDTTSTVTTADTKVSSIQSGHHLTGRTNGTQLWGRLESENPDGVSSLSSLVTATPVASAIPKLYWSVSGSDTTGDGSVGTPYATPTKCRDVIRTATGRTSAGQTALPGDWQGYEVIGASGTYRPTSVIALDERDSGSPTYEIVYKASSPGNCIISGAVAVSDGAWALVTSGDTFAWARLPSATRASTYVLDVTALGIDKGYNGDSGYSFPFDQLLVVDDAAVIPRTVFPAGAAGSAGSWLGVDAATDGGYGNAATFTVGSSTPYGWNPSGQDIYSYGFLGESWFIAWERLSTITNSGGSSLATIPSRNGAYRTTSSNNKFMRFVNALEAMTSGHVAWAQSQGKLYYLPTSGAPSGVALTLLDTVLQLGVDEQSSRAANYVRFEGLVFEGTRNEGVQVYRSSGVTFDGVTLRNCGGTGTYWEDVTDCHLTNSTVDNCMSEGVIISNAGNGSKATLTSSGCTVTSTNFTGNGWGMNDQNRAALALPGNGCGIAISTCAFTGNYSRAILSDSALVTIDTCTFNGDVLMSGDAGAVSNGRKVTDVGMEVTNCTFDNIRHHPMHNASTGAVFGVYLDDAMSWATITDNTFNACDAAMQLASGKGLIVRRNKFTNCSGGHHGAPVVLSDRSGFGIETALEADLAAYTLTVAPWSTDWPLIKDLRPGQPLRTPIDHLRIFGVPVFLDNMATDGSYIARIARSNTWDATATYGVNDTVWISAILYKCTTGHINHQPPNATYWAVEPYIDLTQLNYPIGATGTPANGGGTVQLGTIYKQ